MSVFSNPAAGTPEQTREYVKAILALLGDRDPMEVLRATPNAMTQAVIGLSLDQRRQPEAPGKWSINDMLQHLGDSEIVWSWRMRLILAQDRPTLTGYDQDAWAARLGYGEAASEDALELFGVLRRANLRLLARATPADLQRVGLHTERGEETLEHQRRLYAGHDLLHLRQLARIRGTISAAT
jgi:uncharacterized damage-inducible protein DinB